MPLCYHPVNKNAVLVVNLAQDPEEWIHLSAEELAERLFTPQTQASPPRPGIKAIHLNKCPIVATPKLLDEQTQARLGIDKQVCENHWQRLKQLDLTAKLQATFSMSTFAPREDPERKLYEGFYQTQICSWPSSCAPLNLATYPQTTINLVINACRR